MSGGLVILLGFGVLAAFGGGLTFDDMRAARLLAAVGQDRLRLAFVGFGMKAGLVPLHAWLPEAHPVAPSHISALMCGVMLKVALYGFIRVIFDLIGDVPWQWGVVVLVIGTASALLGVLYALMQHDLKRLLAYHSVENIGIIFIGLGLSLIFLGSGHSCSARSAWSRRSITASTMRCSRACCSSAPAPCSTAPTSATWIRWAG